MGAAGTRRAEMFLGIRRLRGCQTALRMAIRRAEQGSGVLAVLVAVR